MLLLQLHYLTLHYTRLHWHYTITILHYSTQHYSTLRYSTFHYTNQTTPQLQLHCNYKHTTLIALHYNYNYNYNSTTPQLQLQVQLRYTTLHPAVVGEVTTATIVAVTTPKNTTPTYSNHFSVHQWIRFAIHASQQLTSPIFETSATALCGTTGIYSHKRNLNCTATLTRNDGALDILNPPQHPSTNWTLIQNQNLCIFGADWNCFCS